MTGLDTVHVACFAEALAFFDGIKKTQRRDELPTSPLIGMADIALQSRATAQMLCQDSSRI